ncbi:peptidyl-tRNA hydrolase [Xylariaceae sp. FL0804]|nr:peptidyl-tRNA hydrolase [Xylariaceae sp. FL0804]
MSPAAAAAAAQHHPPLRLLVISLGNPAPYLDTLHSAGHHALAAVQKLLLPGDEGEQSQPQPEFRRARHGGKPCLASASPGLTLLQSPTMMNNCGPWVARAWREALASQAPAPAQKGQQQQQERWGLVIVHDDLESPLGATRVREWRASHKGHNGMRSVLASLPAGKLFPGAGGGGAGAGALRAARVSVGIGRPASRDPDVVSEYVLRQVTRRERDALAAEAGPGVLRCLRELRGQWEEEEEEEEEDKGPV